jgi:hypothetical protein
MKHFAIAGVRQKIASRCCVLRADKCAGKRPTEYDKEILHSFFGIFAASTRHDATYNQGRLMIK